jgi:hypothetical protein
MKEASGKSVGRILGWFCVLVGLLSTGFGIWSIALSRSLEAIDALLLGGLAIAAGVVILHRRNRDEGRAFVATESVSENPDGPIP